LDNGGFLLTITTPNDIRTKGLKALAEALGPVGMVRFLQQFDIGKGDYTKDRKKWLEDLSINSIVDKIRKNE